MYIILSLNKKQGLDRDIIAKLLQLEKNDKNTVKFFISTVLINFFIISIPDL